jgi:hypothetical protein
MSPDPITISYRRAIIALIWLNVAITFSELARETARNYLFTLIGLILIATALPYVLALTVLPRFRARWATALGIATCVWGLMDAAWRVQAFFYPTLRSGREMGFWLPIYGVLAIPFITVIAHTFLTAFRPEA